LVKGRAIDSGECVEHTWDLRLESVRCLSENKKGESDPTAQCGISDRSTAAAHTAVESDAIRSKIMIFMTGIQLTVR
jgi:hypothetical protein